MDSKDITLKKSSWRPARVREMDLQRRLELVKRLPTEEVVTEEGLQELFKVNEHPRHYIGLEISGMLHLGSLVLTGFKLNDFMEAGIKCRVFLADWHSYINNKFGGDWQKIKQASRYYEEAFRVFSPGVEVLLGSDLYRNNDEYWRNLVIFCKQITLARVSRCLTIMGRTEREQLDFGQYLYPPMQSVDIKAMDLDIVHAGMDQRKVHMLVREVFPRLGWKVPVAIHQHVLPGLSEPTRMGLEDEPNLDLRVSSKMSKSKPWTAIFVHDSLPTIQAKLRKAWCPVGQADYNPVLELARYLGFRANGFSVERPSKYGGDVVYETYRELENDYLAQRLHPADLKNATAEAVDKAISPVRKHFETRRDLLRVFETEERQREEYQH